MGKYIVYRLNGVGKIVGAEWIDAPGDRLALELARRLAAPGGCEVWQLDRRVGKVGLPCCSPTDGGSPALPASAQTRLGATPAPGVEGRFPCRDGRLQ